MENYKRYIDANGYPGCIDYDGSWDGGDTAAIMGNLWALDPDTRTKLPPLPWDDVNGVPLRHPDKTKWYGQPDRFSRDQLVAVLCGFALGGRWWYGKERGFVCSDWYKIQLFKAHKREAFSWAWNTRGNGKIDAKKKFPDLTAFEVWALWLRIYKPWWARLVLWFCDLETLAGALDWKYRRADNVCRNHMLVSIASTTVLPTWVSRFANSLNDWPELLLRWHNHCIATGEFPTDEFFVRYHAKNSLRL